MGQTRRLHEIVGERFSKCKRDYYILGRDARRKIVICRISRISFLSLKDIRVILGGMVNTERLRTGSAISSPPTPLQRTRPCPEPTIRESVQLPAQNDTAPECAVCESIPIWVRFTLSFCGGRWRYPQDPRLLAATSRIQGGCRRTHRAVRRMKGRTCHQSSVAHWLSTLRWHRSIAKLLPLLFGMNSAQQITILP